MAELSEISRIKAIHKETFFAKKNVIGVGAGYKTVKGKQTSELCVVTLVRQKLPSTAISAEAMIPKTIEGIPTDVLEVGEIRALASPTDRWRPAPGGVSIGHYQITAGTLGCVVHDRATGVRLILSNNHVLADSNNGEIGDPILQPGPADGGTVSADTIAHLERFHTIEFLNEPGTCNIAKFVADFNNFLARLLGSQHQFQSVRVNAAATNQVDAALARPVNDADLRSDILNIGDVTGVTAAELGMPLRKSGRTTGHTTGEVLVLDASVDVSYGTNQTARFDEQIVAGAMSAGGDSGSLVVTGTPPLAVGLLFAGSDQSTILNPIQLVLDTLEITIP